MEDLKKYLKDKNQKSNTSVIEKIWEFPYLDLERWDVWWKIEILKNKVWWEILFNIRRDNKKFKN